MKVSLRGTVSLEITKIIEVPDGTDHVALADMAHELAMNTPYCEWETRDLTTDFFVFHKVDSKPTVCMFWYSTPNGDWQPGKGETQKYLHRRSQDGFGGVATWVEEGEGLPEHRDYTHADIDRWISDMESNGYDCMLQYEGKDANWVTTPVPPGAEFFVYTARQHDHEEWYMFALVEVDE